MTQLPPSASRLWVNLVGVACYVAVLCAAFSYDPDIAFLPLFGLGIAALALPILLLELCVLKTYRRDQVGWQPVPAPVENAMVKRKVLGLNATLAALFAAYLLLPEYSKPIYGDYLKLYFAGGLLVVGGGFIYLNYITSRLPDKEDGFWQVGAWLAGDREAVQWPLLVEHCKRWLVKGFFLPLMVAGAGLYYIEFWEGHLLYSDFQLVAPEVQTALHSFAGRLSLEALERNDYVLLLLFFVTSLDVMFGVIGYVLTLRILDAHIRSTEPTLFGWLVCLVCYPPFWMVVGSSYLAAGSETLDWRVWLQHSPDWFFAWGVLVCLAYGTYTLCTVTMGIRVSNLCYRGLITSGPYRYSKHPQYIAKWCAWLLMLVPFISPVGPFTALRSVVLLVALGVLYYWRARTEENHLSNYPAYVAYAEWMNEHGLLRKLGQWVPYLRYSQARAQASGSIIWQKKGR